MKNYIKCINVDYESSGHEDFYGQSSAATSFKKADNQTSNLLSRVSKTCVRLSTSMSRSRHSMATTNTWPRDMVSRTPKRVSSLPPSHQSYIFSYVASNTTLSETPSSRSTIDTSSLTRLTLRSSYLRMPTDQSRTSTSFTVCLSTREICMVDTTSRSSSLKRMDDGSSLTMTGLRPSPTRRSWKTTLEETCPMD